MEFCTSISMTDFTGLISLAQFAILLPVWYPIITRIILMLPRIIIRTVLITLLPIQITRPLKWDNICLILKRERLWIMMYRKLRCCLWQILNCMMSIHHWAEGRKSSKNFSISDNSMNETHCISQKTKNFAEWKEFLLPASWWWFFRYCSLRAISHPGMILQRFSIQKHWSYSKTIR